MHEEVKQAVQTGDIKRLKYIFVDSLDVDPTFENYREDFDYCVKHNIFENHEVLTKLQKEPFNWTFDYWKSLKKDLTKNFSKKRMEHMIEVAKVVYKEKVERLKKERSKSSNSKIDEPIREEVRLKAKDTSIQNSTIINSIQEREKRELEEAKRRLAEENAKLNREDAQKRELDEERRRLAKENEAIRAKEAKEKAELQALREEALRKRNQRQQESDNGLLKGLVMGAGAIGGALLGLGSLLGGSPQNPKNKPPKH